MLRSDPDRERASLKLFPPRMIGESRREQDERLSDFLRFRWLALNLVLTNLQDAGSVTRD